MAKTRQIKDSAFLTLEAIVLILANTSIDDIEQLNQIKNTIHNWSLLLKTILNE